MKPDKKEPKKILASKTCVCCEERLHAGIPDNELQGYVCKDCSVQLRFADSWLRRFGMPPMQMV